VFRRGEKNLETFMKIALVIGSTVSTVKDEVIRGRKLLIVRDADTAGKATGEPYIAVDTGSAGTGDLVMVTDGSSARYTNQTTNAPVDAVIVGVIDSLEMAGNVTYRKE
jgi:microcompartment protein CcmK/EutM